ncbi:hypothetical protein [Flavobacterium sp. N2038]|uniref:hypothetical protein n=1 Tax=Flavobacterium sp. N2038 TaxID=2986829 RepID=UPI0022248B95|nr:hypothetical protein [Flavobacterium sp. N2038]
MKIIKAIFPVLFLTIISVSSVFAGTTPPAQMPPPARRGVQPQGGQPLPGMPIDQNLIFLVVGGILLGAVYIYKDEIKKKLQF